MIAHLSDGTVASKTSKRVHQFVAYLQFADYSAWIVTVFNPFIALQSCHCSFIKDSSTIVFDRENPLNCVTLFFSIIDRWKTWNCEELQTSGKFRKY